MPSFEITGPDGAKYQVTGPEGSTAEQALARVRSQAEPMPQPPPGAIIHGATSSTVAGSGLTAERSADPQQAAVELEALKQRSEGRNLDGVRGLAPLLQGLSFNFGDEAVSAGTGAIRAVKGGNFANEQAIAQEIQRQELARERTEHPIRSTATEIGGGLATGLGAFGAGATAARAIPAGLQGAARFGASVGAGAADAGVYGALSGFGAGNGMEDRFSQAAHGAVGGAAIGAGLPVVGKVASALAAPVLNPIMSRFAPESFANSKLIQTYRRAGMEPQDVSQALQAARSEGQPMFSVADALGNAGQRATAGVARIPQNERQGLVDFLEARQAGQGRRVANTLAEGFDTPQTAAQLRTTMETARTREADTIYSQVRRDAGPVNLTGVINRVDQTLQPGLSRLAHPGSNIADDSVESALRSVRDRLTDGRSTMTDFTAIQRARGDLADKIATAERAGQGNKARLLGGVLREMDTAMENASPGFREANRRFALRSQAIDAIEEGSTAANRGRLEDTIPAYQGQSSRAAQLGYRTGYADPLIAQAQGAPMGVNKARPFTSDAFAAEAGAMAPNAPAMARRMGRENTMFETRNQAIGGSRTAENLADAGDVHIADPAILANLLSGNFVNAARHAGGRVMAELSGTSPGVAERLTQRLMETDPGRALAHIDAARNSLSRRETTRDLVLRALAGGSVAGVSAAQ